MSTLLLAVTKRGRPFRKLLSFPNTLERTGSGKGTEVPIGTWNHDVNAWVNVTQSTSSHYQICCFPR